MYYGVRKGFKVGVFEDWTEVSLSVQGYSSPEYKKFKSKEEATAYIENKDFWEHQMTNFVEDGYLVAITNGAYHSLSKMYSYGVVLKNADGEEVISGKMPSAIKSDKIGKISAIKQAIEWAISNGYQKLKIFTEINDMESLVHRKKTTKSKVKRNFLMWWHQNEVEKNLDVEFIPMNRNNHNELIEKARVLSRKALVDQKEDVIQGNNYFSVSYILEEDLQKIINTLKRENQQLICDVENQSEKIIYRLNLNFEILTLTLFKTKKHKLLVQGTKSMLFQMVITTIVEVIQQTTVEEIMEEAYGVKIDRDLIEKEYTLILKKLPETFPPGIIRLLKQSLINIYYYVESEDYAQYAFPALRALEGYMWYLVKVAGGKPGTRFDFFNKVDGIYKISCKFPNNSNNELIEACYNYYHSERNSLVHFGDVDNEGTDQSRSIFKKDEADGITRKCIELMTTPLSM